MKITTKHLVVGGVIIVGAILAWKQWGPKNLFASKPSKPSKPSEPAKKAAASGEETYGAGGVPKFGTVYRPATPVFSKIKSPAQIYNERQAKFKAALAAL